MSFKHVLKLYRAGVLVDVVDDFISCTYTNELNAVGYLKMDLDSRHVMFTELQLDDEIDFIRYNNHKLVAVPEHIDFNGVYRGMTQATDGKKNTFSIHCPSVTYYLQNAILAYKAGQEGSSQFTNRTTDYIVRSILNLNTNTNATAARLLPVGVKHTWPTGGWPTGTSISYAAAYKNVLEAIQELIKIDNFDIKVYRWAGLEGFIDLKALYGTDRSTSVFFFLEQGNMVGPVLDKRRQQEPTVALVAGQGEGTARATEVRYSPNYDDTTNHHETFVDARDLSTAAAMQARGDAKLQEGQYKPLITFDVMQTPGCIYGKHYFLGDKVTAVYAGERTTKKIVSVTVDVGAGEEKIRLGLEDA